MSVHAHHERDLQRIVRTWWRRLRGLDPRTGAVIENSEPKRGDLARLRRIRVIENRGAEEIDMVSALQVEEFVQLWRDSAHCFAGGLDDSRIEFAAVAACALARITTDAAQARDTAALLGAGGEKKLLAESRFRRLIRADRAADLLDQSRRVVTLLGGAAPVGELGASLMLWGLAPQIKRRWAFAYYSPRATLPTHPLPNTIQAAVATGASS